MPLFSAIHCIKSTWRFGFFYSLMCMSAANAGHFSGCATQFYQQIPPQILRDSLKQQNYPLCFNGFGVLYSGVSRTPLWSAEYISPQRLKQAKTIGRQGEFYEEPRVSVPYRSRLSHYSRSGYDRGHMAPNGDMANRTQQADSFSLANMVPQSPYNNQEVWRNLEEATRALVLKKQAAAYVITGPAFLGQRIKKIGGRQGVLVPTHIYKVVYFPALNAASAYLTVNDERARLQLLSVSELEQKIGINLLPALPKTVKSQLVNLPLTAVQANKGSFNLWGHVNPQYTQALPMPNASQDSSRPQSSSRSDDQAEQSLMQLLKYKLLNWLVDYMQGKS